MNTQTPDSEMDIESCHGYHFAGNYWVAIAINIKDPSDAHYFTNQTASADGFEQGALTRAIGWAYPGPTTARETKQEREERQERERQERQEEKCAQWSSENVKLFPPPPPGPSEPFASP
jgi:hypothetical protein